jgi:predicted  nucleic acid-binding Zn-ribbon protein
MGLFKKKPSADPAEVAALRSELADVRAALARLDESASALLTTTKMDSAMSAEQLSAVEARLLETTARLGAIDQLQSRVEAAETAAARVAEIDHLQSRVEAAETAAARVAEIDQLTALPVQVAAIAEQVATTSADAAAARELAASLEARVAQVGTELANQLAELGREMDSLAARPFEPTKPPLPTSEAVVEQLRESQVRLANEQARYEIAFREDLATLAEQVRLLRGR